MQTLIEVSIILGTIGIFVGLTKFVNYIKEKNTPPPLSLYMPKSDIEQIQHINFINIIALRRQAFNNIDMCVDMKKTTLNTLLKINYFKSYQDYCNAYDQLMEEKKKAYEEVYEKYKL